MLKQKRLSAGQTLIETLITVAVLAVSITVLIQFQGYLVYDNLLARQRADAVLLAASRIESLKDFQVLNNISGYASWQGIASGSAVTVGKSATYTTTWTVTSYTNPTWKKVRVTVTWTDSRGNSQSIEQDMNIAAVDFQFSAAIM